MTVLLAPLLMSSVTSAESNPRVGYDVSWPQCGQTLPTDHAFAIVGVNGGTAATTNPCLADQLRWANQALGGSSQSKVQLYVNTANPGQVRDQITTWPTSNTDKTGFTTNNPYGKCNGSNHIACSWQYGWNRSVEALQDRFKPAARVVGLSAAAPDYVWWLDVETINTWQEDAPRSHDKNVATIEGMVSFYQSKGAKVGLYSTAFQWNEIVGSRVSKSSKLNGLPSWLAGAANLSDAQNFCGLPPLTRNGQVVLTQYIENNLDKNYACQP